MKFTPETDPKDWSPGSGKKVMPPNTVKKLGTGHGMTKPSAGTSPVEFKGSPPPLTKPHIESPPYKHPRSHNK